jgi:hypothetical protein
VFGRHELRHELPLARGVEHGARPAAFIAMRASQSTCCRARHRARDLLCVLGQVPIHTAMSGARTSSRQSA